MEDRDLERIQHLVGNVTKKQLRHVECYVSKNLGIFIPSVGFCEYAITPSHIHPSYFFIVFFSKEQTYMPIETEVLPHHYPAVLIAPGFPHEEPVGDHFVRYIAIGIDKVFYNEQYVLCSNHLPSLDHLRVFAVDEGIMTYIKQFMKECEDKKVGYEELLDALTRLITHFLIRGLEVRGEESSDRARRVENIEMITAYIHQYFGERLTIKKLARMINLSESHFMKKFKEQTGTSPIAYLIEVRLEKSKRLLRDTTQSITEVALQCGFSSASHFSAVFTKESGITPKAYRALYEN